jgi:hypothetical protein
MHTGDEKITDLIIIRREIISIGKLINPSIIRNPNDPLRDDSKAKTPRPRPVVPVHQNQTQLERNPCSLPDYPKRTWHNYGPKVDASYAGK